MLSATALRQTIQEFPPPNSLGASLWFSATERGWYLPAYGERARDQKLRDYDRHEDNALWQGAEAGFLKWAANVPWEITGQGYVVVDRGRGPEHVDAVAYFTALLQDAHFGAGWKYWVQRGGRDFLSQDFGWLVELIGPGDPSAPLQGAVSGIAVLDSLRCFATGNPFYPIIYFSQITGKLHRLHASRVARFVDMPDGDERLYGNGLCALARYISIAQQQIYMSRYIVQNLDDKPKPGVNIWSNLSEGGVQTALDKYLRETGSDELGPLGKTINVYSIDPTAPAKLDSITFSNPPEKFDYRTYMDIHVNALALALGVDKQELWELGGGNLGSGQQSEILAQKARGKAKGDFLTTIERFVNIRVLPDADAVGSTCAVSFKFKYKDEEEERALTEKDQALVTLAEGLKRLGFDNSTIANLLADRSETFKELLSNAAGQVQVGTAGDDAITPERTAADDTPQLQEQPTAPAPSPNPISAPQTKGLETDAQRRWFFANNPQYAGGSDLPRLREGLSYGHSVAPHQLRAGEEFVHLGNAHHSSMGGRISKVNPKKIRYTTEYMGKPMDLEARHEDLHGGFVQRVNKIHPIRIPGRKDYVDSKAYDDTRTDFIATLTDLIHGGLADDMNRRRFGIVMRAQLRRLGQQAYEDGLAEGGVTGGEIDDADTARIQGWLGEQSQFVTAFADTVYKEGLGTSEIARRAELWANKSLESVYQEGLRSADANGAYEWILGDAEKHCETCKRLNGQVHRLRGWYQKDLLPKRDKLNCGGWQCTCTLKRTTKPAQGRY